MTEFTTIQQAVLDAATRHGHVPCVLPGVDPRALGSAVRVLVAAGELVACPQQDVAYAKDSTSFRPAGNVESEPDVEDDKPVRTKVGVMVASYHARYTAQGGGCADNVDTEMRDAFLTRVTEHADTPKCDVDALRAWGEAIGLWRGKWDARNAGMMRMNLANRVRAAIRHGATIELNGTVLTIAR